MDSATRKGLEELAIERLAATADDEEPWSFLFRTNGSICLSYWPWSEVENYTYHPAMKGLDLPWTPERRKLLEAGDAAPNEEELLQWRWAVAKQMATESEDKVLIWIVPLAHGPAIDGFAAFAIDGAGGPEDPPILEGVFESIDEATAALAEKGVFGDKA
jgi:hypothetical protein